MKKQLRHAALTLLKGCGIFARMKDSAWRQQRLLILCYHGVAIDDENTWDPTLFISPGRLGLRLRALADGKYAVLPLGEALERLYRKIDLQVPSPEIRFHLDYYTVRFLAMMERDDQENRSHCASAAAGGLRR